MLNAIAILDHNFLFADQILNGAQIYDEILFFSRLFCTNVVTLKHRTFTKYENFIETRDTLCMYMSQMDEHSSRHKSRFTFQNTNSSEITNMTLTC